MIEGGVSSDLAFYIGLMNKLLPTEPLFWIPEGGTRVLWKQWGLFFVQFPPVPPPPSSYPSHPTITLPPPLLPPPSFFCVVYPSTYTHPTYIFSTLNSFFPYNPLIYPMMQCNFTS